MDVRNGREEETCQVSQLTIIGLDVRNGREEETRQVSHLTISGLDVKNGREAETRQVSHLTISGLDVRNVREEETPSGVIPGQAPPAVEHSTSLRPPCATRQALTLDDVMYIQFR